MPHRLQPRTNRLEPSDSPLRKGSPLSALWLLVAMATAASGATIRVEPATDLPGSETRSASVGNEACVQSFVGDVEFELCLPSDTFEFGDLIEMVYTVTNQGQDPVSFFFNTLCQEHFAITDDSCEDPFVCGDHWDSTNSCFQANSQITIAPGDSREFQFTYRQHTDGGYRLRPGSFRAWGVLLENPSTRVSVPIEIFPHGPEVIQDAVDLASPGDTVLVAPGTYPENINILDKEIVLVSEGGPEVTILDGGGRGSILYMDRTSHGAVVEGFTLQNGAVSSGDTDGNRPGGAISLLQTTAPTIRRNIFRGNSSDRGGAIHTNYQCTALIERNLFVDNNAIQGGALFLWADSPQIRRNTFVGNSADEGGAVFDGGVLGRSSVFDNIFYENTATSAGGGLYCAEGADATGAGCNNFWENEPDDFLACDEFSPFFFEDPLFCDPGSGDYTLRSDSPCLPGNSPCGRQVGAYGEGCATTDVAVTDGSTLMIRTHPNPFREDLSLTIDWSELEAAGVTSPRGPVILRLFDAAGRELQSWEVAPHSPSWTWDGRVDGRPAASGVFQLRLELGNDLLMRRSLVRIR